MMVKRAAFLLALLSSSAGAAAGTTYEYDDLGRLKTAAYDNNKQIAYTYDAAGNRTQVTTQTNAPHAGPAKPTRNAKRARTPPRKTR